MPGRGPDMWRQSCSCNLDARVRQIEIGGVIVGLVGLDDALKQVDALGRAPGPETAAELLELLKPRNYVARGEEGKLTAALLVEYSAYWKRRHGKGRGEGR